MKGFEHPALADIAELQHVVGEQYDPASIPKELVQNADDARAQQLHFGWWPGRGDSAHPLLRGPAVLVLNDGQFRPENLEGIRLLGLGSKGAEPGSIGKFGRGMKSIFHLCEAFIYLASANQPAAQGHLFCDILNPWSGSGHHDDWDLLTEQAELTKVVEQWGHETTQWFCLWLPLRRPEQLADTAPIKDAYPKVGDFFSADLPLRLARLFPFLRSLKTITLWRWTEHGSMTPDVTLSLETTDRIRFPDLAPGQSGHLAGELNLVDQNSGEHKTLPFCVRESMLGDPQFARLQQNEESWPARPTYDRQAKLTMVREKGLPHAGAAFSLLPAARPNGGQLEVKRAVFLPLSSTLYKLQLGGPYDFQLLLHGYYILDSGRKDIHPDTRWNELLDSEGALPLVLSALDDLKNRTRFLSAENLRRLTAGLSSAEFLRQGIPALCRNHQWLYRLGAQHGDWSLLPADTSFVCMPAPPEEADWTPQELFPALRTLAPKTAITFGDWPRLSPQRPASWTAVGRWAELLDAPVEPFLRGSDRFEYLNQILRHERDEAKEAWDGGPPAVVAPLLDLGRRLFRALTPETVEARAQELKEFVTMLPSRAWFALPTGEGELTMVEHATILKDLLDLDLRILLVPSDLATAHRGKLSTEDAAHILARLASAPGQPKKIAAVALDVVDGVAPQERDELRRQAGKLKLFRLFDLKAEREIAACWDELAAWQAESKLFAPGGGLLELLQRALSTVQLYRLPPDRTGKVLLAEDGLGACAASDCVAMLSQAPRLAPREQRKPILERLLGANVSGVAKALRYLLHGHPTHISEVDVPLLAGTEEGDVWARLASLTLGHSDTAWRLVPAELAEALSPEHRSQLKINPVGPESVAGLLAESDGLDWLDGAVLSADERHKVLAGLRDPELWYRLPLHETSDGRLVALNERTFLVSAENPIPADFTGLATGIKIPVDPTLRAIYQDRIRQWDSAACIDLALAQPRPDQFYRAILGAIEKLGVPSGALGREVLTRIRSACWLPTRHGPRAPEDVIHLPQIEDAIVRLLAEPELQEVFVDSSSIISAVREHPAHCLMVRRLVYATGPEGLEKLGLALAEVPTYRLGLPASVLENPDFIPVLLEAFDDGGPAEFPVFALLHAAAAKYQAEISRLIEPLLKPIEPERLRIILEYLSVRHTRATGDARTRILDFHAYYLRALTETPDFSPDEIGELKLLSRRKHWKSARALTLNAPGIDDDYLLDKRQEDILAPALGTSGAPAMPAWTGSSEERPLNLESYFSAWDGHVPSEIIGGFLALLGNEPSIMHLAAEMLRGRRTVAGVRQMIEWEKATDGQRAVGADEDIEETMAKQPFRLFLHPSSSSSTATVFNLLGQPFSAPLRNTPENLFVGNLTFETGSRRCTAVLREIEPTRFSKAQLSALLRESAAVILQRVYARSQADNLDRVWRELSDSEQLDLEVAQRLILDSAFFYFGQLRESSLSGALQELRKRWNELRREEAERGSRSAEQIRNQKDDLYALLKRALEDNPAVQADALAAVKRKIQEYQYKQSSIPFELFQNADDSAAELAEMVGPDQLSPASERFLVIDDRSQLRFLHWGRVINRFRGGHFPAATGMNRGFDRDLEKMLVLSSSDKLSESHSTGKFGLGFKSVFLACDVPQIVSGGLAIEVVAGMFPRTLAVEQSQATRRLLAHEAGDSEIGSPEGTAITLPLNSEAIQTSARVLSRFFDLGHVLPVFARQIKECIVIGAEGQKQNARWESKPVGGYQDIRLGRLNPLTGSSHQGSAGLLFECGAAGSVLLGLGPRGFCRLPPTMPSFWVTAPTAELEDSGIAVNGPFELDVGRTQLARSESLNEPRARALGEKLGHLLEGLHRASANWDALRADTQLARDTTPEELWRSLWDIFVRAGLKYTTSDSPAAYLLRVILWGDRCGMAWLLSHADALPTGLPGDYSCLSRLPRLKYFTSGTLDTPELFEQVSAWPSFAVAPGSIVSREVCDLLKRLSQKTAEWRFLRLIDVLEWELAASPETDPQTAARLGEVVNPGLLNRLESDPQTKGEAQQIREFLGLWRFKSQACTWVPASDLVSGGEQAERDEALRAGFAPPERLLHGDYTGTAHEFFRACRGNLRAPAELLAQWGREAGEEDQQEAFLRYLIEGDRGFAVSQSVCGDRAGTWLDSVHQSAAFAKFSGPYQSTILGRLGFAPAPSAPEPEPLPLRPASEVRAFLNDVEAWWSDKNNRAALIRHYLRYQYPGGQQPDLSGEDRKSWMVLVVRAIGYTLGRTQDSQTRAFIESCDQSGWLDTFAMEPPPRSGSSEEWNRRWIGLLDQFATEGIEYVQFFQWVKLLPIIYRIAISLEKYIELFRGLDRGPEGELTVAKILNPALDEELDSGVFASSLTQSVGLGIFFILRELVRLQVIRGDRIRSHCFVPTLQMRRAFASLGCDLNVDAKGTSRLDWSRQIIEFLQGHGVQDPSFADTFDIPFIALFNPGWLAPNDYLGHKLAQFWDSAH